ncbi:hypothetical protein D8M21_09130 [Kocuria sp. HSID16901]|nr:hypothetical protein D8M21_09130 [Kocuria sp. HSID16901]
MTASSTAVRARKGVVGGVTLTVTVDTDAAADTTGAVANGVGMTAEPGAEAGTVIVASTIVNLMTGQTVTPAGRIRIRRVALIVVSATSARIVTAIARRAQRLRKSMRRLPVGNSTAPC